MGLFNRKEPEPESVSVLEFLGIADRSASHLNGDSRLTLITIIATLLIIRGKRGEDQLPNEEATELADAATAIYKRLDTLGAHFTEVEPRG